jgi:predicted alpha/beta superfamily hydrolase
VPAPAQGLMQIKCDDPNATIRAMLNRRHAVVLGATTSAAMWAPEGHAQAPTVRPSTVGDPSRLLLLPPLAMPGLNRSRTVRVYLPPSYAQSGSRRYPVVYFHDGQNVFDAATSYAGEWGADEVLDALAARTGFEAIAVAIDHGGAQRTTELNPWGNARFGAGEGEAYLAFVMRVVKPAVDAQFRTQPARAHTAMVGSSLGGLITVAALHRYGREVGAGAVLSPALWIAPEVFGLSDSQPLLPTTRVFLYAGGRESPAMVPDAERLRDQLRPACQLQWLVNPEANHSEPAWRAVLPQALQHLFGLPA